MDWWVWIGQKNSLFYSFVRKFISRDVYTLYGPGSNEKQIGSICESRSSLTDAVLGDIMSILFIKDWLSKHITVSKFSIVELDFGTNVFAPDMYIC